MCRWIKKFNYIKITRCMKGIKRKDVREMKSIKLVVFWLAEHI